jgi:hypothetical protein
MADYVYSGIGYLIFVASLVGWVATTGKSGEHMSFWWIFGFGWALFATGYLLTGIEAAKLEDWFVPVLRYGGLGLLFISVINLIWAFSEERFGS